MNSTEQIEADNNKENVIKNESKDNKLNEKQQQHEHTKFHWGFGHKEQQNEHEKSIENEKVNEHANE